MSQMEHGAERPYSPCTNQCVYDESSGHCRGCHRTMDEIMGWPGLSDDRRERIWRRVEASLARQRAGQGTGP
ncbi:MAG: DUF1289 domain-containing protein [Armatimonadetes bacterium]|nr:DUF1289 domain-containing protein [Armatimonadota bacterium]